MIGIESIGVYVPSSYDDNFENALRFKESKEFVSNKIGAIKLPKAEDGSAAQMGYKAVLDLINKSGLKKEEIDALIVVTQNPDHGGIPHTSSVIHNNLDLDNNVSCFDLGLGCSGYVYGLSVLKSHMIEMGFKKGILITSDPYSNIIDVNDRVTSMLFGDAATATLLSNEAIFSISRPALQTQGEDNPSLQKNTYLDMNGRAVFNFAATYVPKQIKNYLTDNNIEDVDLYILHQGSKAIVDTIRRKIGQDSCVIPFDIKNTGNTISSSVPLLLEKYLEKNKYKKIILSGFGVGLSWATILIERVNYD
jgi:3-oxoacyl-[acyl-carrier-protein] synthase-3